MAVLDARELLGPGLAATPQTAAITDDCKDMVRGGITITI